MVNISHILNNQYSTTIHHNTLSVNNSHSVYYPTCLKLLRNHYQRDTSLKYGSTALISVTHRIQSRSWQYNCISFNMQQNKGFCRISCLVVYLWNYRPLFSMTDLRRKHHTSESSQHCNNFNCSPKLPKLKMK